MQTSKIRGFRGQYQFLSNFYACDIKVGELTFTSVEAAFQAAKCANAEDRAQFQGLTAADAKTLGRRVTLRADWEQVKLTILAKLVKMKFTGNPELMAKLLATGDAVLVEENTWHDNFYGDCVCNRCRSVRSQNMLGCILMELRDKRFSGRENPIVFPAFL